jgi:hypothetical protein
MSLIILPYLTAQQKIEIKNKVESGKASILDMVRIYREYPKNEILAIFNPKK